MSLRHGKCIAGIAVMLLLTVLPTVSSASIVVVVDEFTGEVFLRNSGAVSEVFDGYQIDSVSSSLNAANLTSITSTYALSGDMSVDASSDWFVLSQLNSSVAEASLTDSSGSLLPNQAVSLGNLWNVGGTADLSVFITSGASFVSTTVDFLDLRADYDSNFVIDELDYDVFVSTFGSTTDLRADGNGNNVVDAADYTVWRDAYTPVVLSANSGGSILGLATAVPEPSSCLLALLASLVAGSASRRR